MQDKELDSLLKKLPGIFDQTAGGFSEEMRSSVQSRVKQSCQAQGSNANRRFSLKIAVFILFFLLGSGSGLFLKNGATVPAGLPSFNPVETRVVDLDGEGTPEMVSTLKVKGEDKRENLVALIWALDGYGQWQVISSQTLQGSEILPLEILSPSEQNGHLVVISTAEDDQRVSYRVLGYDGRAVLPYLERSSKLLTEREQMLEEIRTLLPVNFGSSGRN